MRCVIVAWCKTNSTQFENHVPLKFVGTRNNKLGFKTEIDVLFLEGYNLIDDNYKAALKELGYKLHDATKIFSELEIKYGELDRFGEYEKKCFLRWLIIGKCFSGERIIHFDGDIVFNDCPHSLSEKLSGKTFVLQGCPALTVISDQNWFTQYAENLNWLTSDITGYSSMAWGKRLEWEDAAKTWTGLRDREIISSDQDLFRHLLHSKGIHQDKPEIIQQGLDNYILCENPLYADAYYPNLKPFKYKRVEGIDFLNEKRVAFWHVQGDFNSYLGDFVFRKKYLNVLPFRRLPLKGKGFESHLRRLFMKVINIKQFSRLDTYKYFFEEYDFSELFTAETWWSEEVFQ